MPTAPAEPLLRIPAPAHQLLRCPVPHETVQYIGANPDVNSVIQNVKRRARGFRNMDHFATMIYLTCGKPDLKAITAA